MYVTTITDTMGGVYQQKHETFEEAIKYLSEFQWVILATILKTKE